MKKLFYCLILSLLTLVGCNKDDENAKWEYKVVTLGDGSWAHLSHMITQDTKMEDFFPTLFEDPTVELDALGEEGWELVNVYTTTETTYPNMGKSEYHTGVKENTRTQTVNFVFKRKKTNDSKSKETTRNSSVTSASSNEYQLADSTAVEVVEVTDSVSVWE
ncbi:MAG: DUF4177 domain-containing protein [Muribaculaceae bacterium]|nr:DUF4177 domain-containing protein [Muribaculaceae bacterium]